MCGVVGVLSDMPSMYEPHILEPMLDTIRHRGPDDFGIERLVQDGLAFGHARLSVIDLSEHGHQPMWSHTGDSLIVYNGEIYNYQGIKSELESMGISFRSNCDTEVIINGYAAWGTRIIDKLHGMFAFAIWDQRTKSLLLVRDRLGMKPLYYYYNESQNLFIFASEIKAIVQHPSVAKEVNPYALKSYLSIGYTFAPQTMFKGIYKIPSASIMTFKPGHGAPHVEHYWQIREVAGRHCKKDGREQIRSLVENAVKKRMISDVPLGAFLSGGVDSTLVVGLMSRLTQEPVRTFVAAYAVGPRSVKYNVDAEYAEIAAKHFNTRHTRFTIELNTEILKASVRRLVRAMDEPINEASALSSLLLAEKVRESGITVMLTGNGSDELFGGYPRYQNDILISWAQKIPEVVRRNSLLGIIPSPNLRKVLRKAAVPPFTVERLMEWWGCFSPETLHSLVIPSYHLDLDPVQNAMQTVIQEIQKMDGSPDNRDLMAFADLRLWIAENNNMVIDKTTMNHSLESRSPFLDYRLVEYALSIPFVEKAAFGREKHLLKSIFKDVLPDSILKRPKHGWLSPYFYWMRDALWADIQEVIGRLPETGLFTKEVLQYTQKFVPVGNYPLELWTLYIFGLWYEEFIGYK